MQTKMSRCCQHCAKWQPKSREQSYQAWCGQFRTPTTYYAGKTCIKFQPAGGQAEPKDTKLEETA